MDAVAKPQEWSRREVEVEPAEAGAPFPVARRAMAGHRWAEEGKEQREWLQTGHHSTLMRLPHGRLQRAGLEAEQKANVTGRQSRSAVLVAGMSRQR